MRWRFGSRYNHGGGVYTSPESSLEISNSTSSGSSSSSSLSAATATASSPPPSSSPSVIILVLIIIIVPTVIIIPIVAIISIVIIRGWIQLRLESGNLGCHSFNSLIPFLDGPLQLLYVLGVLLDSTMKMSYGCISGYQGILQNSHSFMQGVKLLSLDHHTIASKIYYLLYHHHLLY